MTFAEVELVLRKLDEQTLLELLDISAEDIVDAFQQRIEDRFDEIQSALSEAA